ncbi:unnamed protein product [Leptidea sinapis]|uniref:Major facilitator superfamily (MFS) profile domain-containing protein n=1 Tax=Leptidea sinapis TaxID=189913 RepID=A0A5E4QSE1_9NEOP|nr:unnamed protein product [Leptidea sinapis]
MWKGPVAQSCYMFGVFTGALYLGGLADKVGRKPVLCWSAVLQLVFGIGQAFTPEYWSFLVVTYVYGIFGSAGAMIPGFVLIMEIVGGSKRTSCGVAFHCFFAIGMILVGIWGAIIDDKTLLQVVYGLHSLILIPHIWIMDESPRWLWAHGRSKEAVDIVQKALKFNNSTEILDRADLVSKGKNKVIKESSSPSSAGTSDLFKTPNLRMKTIIICLSWFANSLVYYGLTLSSGKIAGNPYVIIVIFGMVDIPSYAVVFYFLDIWGRRSFMSTAMLVGGTACVVAAFIPKGASLSTAVVVFGKLFIAASFAIVFNYSAELFPTVLRNSGIGVGSMFARLSGALTPLITLLESFNPKIPSVTFGLVALVSGFLCLFLPETMNQPLPQSLADGESFGKGDTCFSSCLGKRTNKSIASKENDDAAHSIMIAEER